MKCIYKLSFNDETGIECSRCMLAFSKMSINGETELHCSALGIRPKCPEEGNRKDCPLEIVVEN